MGLLPREPSGPSLAPVDVLWESIWEPLRNQKAWGSGP